MSDLLCAGARVLRAHVRLPRIGVWHADIVLATDDVPTGAQSLTSASGDLEFVGTIDDELTKVWQGRCSVRLVGGANGLGRAITSRYYHDVPLRIPLGDLLRECSEVLDTSTNNDAIGVQLGAWVRPDAFAGAALRDLVSKLPAGVVWRVLPNGKVWLGTEEWSAISFAHNVVDESPLEASQTIATDTVAPLLLPGITFNGRRVSRVEHMIDERAVRATVWFERDDATRDRTSAALAAIVEHVMRRTLYHAMWPATVLEQASDDTLSVQIIGGVLPDMVGVPLRTSAPGVRVRVTNGARVLIGFERGDAAKPFAFTFDRDDAVASTYTIEAPNVKLGASATRGVVRVDDTGDAGAMLFVPGTGGAMLTYFAPGDPTTPPPGTPGLISLSTKSTNGSTKVHAE